MLTTFRSIWGVLCPGERRAALWLLGLMIIGMGFETFGVALFLPVLAFLTGPTALPARVPGAFHALYSMLPAGIGLATVMLGVQAFFASKTLFLGFLARRQAHFVFELQAALSERLLQGYLAKPYSFHLYHHSAHLARVALHDSTQFARGAVMACLTLGAETFVLLGVTGLLLVIEPGGAIGVMLFLGATAWVFQKIWGRKLKSWGAEQQEMEGRRIQCFQEGIGAIKEIKMLGREAAILSSFAAPNRRYARLGAHHATLEAMPRLGLELMIVAGVLFAATAALVQGRPMGSLIPLLGVFAAAAFRLLPCTSRLINNYGNLRFSLPALHSMQTELAAIKAEAAAQALTLTGKIPPDWATIEIEDVSYRYSGTSRSALGPVSLTIRRGSVVGIMGPSGSGKTTLMDVLLGLLPPSHGTIRVGGVDCQTDLRGWQKQIGYVPQSIYLADDTLRRNIAFGLAEAQIDEASLESALAAAQLRSLVTELPNGLNTVLGERGVRLSGGQRQRIGIARALYQNSALLVFDEATNALDDETERAVIDAVVRLKGHRTIVMVAHRRSSLEICDVIFNLSSAPEAAVADRKETGS